MLLIIHLIPILLYLQCGTHKSGFQSIIFFNTMILNLIFNFKNIHIYIKYALEHAHWKQVVNVKILLAKWLQSMSK
jgi:hypothetical protein